MSTIKKWPKKRSKKNNSSHLIEEKLLTAIKEKDKEKVSSYLDKLHRMGIHQGFFMDLGKKFLRNPE